MFSSCFCCVPITFRRLGRRARLLSVCLLLMAQAAAAAAPEFVLGLSPEQSSNGVARLSWQMPAPQEVWLQQSADAQFNEPRLIYRGGDSASTLSGLPDGEYFYRLGGLVDGEQRWGEPVRLVVEHHSMAEAWTYFAIGLVVFLATALLVFGGARGARGGA